MKKVTLILAIFVSCLAHAQNPFKSFKSFKATYSILESIIGLDTIPASGTIILKDSILSLPSKQLVVRPFIGIEEIDGPRPSFGAGFRIIGSSEEIWFSGTWDSDTVFVQFSDIVYVAKKQEQDSVVFKVNRFDYIEKNLRLQRTDTEIVVYRDIVRINRDNNEVNLTFSPKEITLKNAGFPRDGYSLFDCTWVEYDSDSVLYVFEMFNNVQFAFRKIISKYDSKDIVYKIRE